jgi:hypothetical protein
MGSIASGHDVDVIKIGLKTWERDFIFRTQHAPVMWYLSILTKPAHDLHGRMNRLLKQNSCNDFREDQLE